MTIGRVEQLRVLRGVAWASSLLSLAGAGLILHRYARHPQLRSFSVRLLFFLSCADVVSAASHYVVWPGACPLQASMQQFGFLASFLWILCIAYDQHARAARGDAAPFRREAAYHALCWGVPLATTAYLAADGALGPTDLPWCWVRPEFRLARWASFYAPQFAVVVAVLVLNCLAFRALHRGKSSRSRPDARHGGVMAHVDRVEVQLYLYVFVFVLVRTPSVVHRLHDLAAPRGAAPVFTLELLHAACSPLQGFINGLLFYSNRSVRLFLRAQEESEYRRRVMEDGGAAAGGDAGRPGERDVDSLLPGGDRLGSGGGGAGDDEAGGAGAGLGGAGGLGLVPFPSYIRKDDILSVFVGTWNMGGGAGAVPSASELRSWIPRGGYDVYAVGVQECAYRPPGGQSIEDHWLAAVEAVIGSSFEVVACQSMSGVRLAVLVRRRLFNLVSDVRVAFEGTGVGSVGRNKGAVGVSFFVGSLSLCFVNAHLAAHKGGAGDRHQDVVQIFRRLAVAPLDMATQFHALYFFGDLNYRINLPTAEVVAAAAAEDWGRLHAHDELIAMRAGRGLFHGFREGALYFPPTYKYRPGGGPGAYDESRTPAWCDRVLCRSRPGVHVQQTFYGHAEDVRSSDHRPVVGSYRIGFRSLLDVPARHRNTLDLSSFLVTEGAFAAGREMAAAAASEGGLGAAAAGTGTAAAATATGPPPGGDRWQVVLSDLRCAGARGPRDLPLGEPFIVFRGEPLEGDVPMMLGAEFSSAGRDQFAWADADVPVLDFAADAWPESDLQAACLVVLLKDQALAGDDDAVGQCSIELRDALGLGGAAFEAAILRDTVYNGYVMGRVHCRRYSPDDLRDARARAQSMYEKAAAEAAVTESEQDDPEEESDDAE